jgi:hypothetical protein
VLVKRSEMAGRSQALPWWLGGGGVKTTEKMHWPVAANYGDKYTIYTSQTKNP